MKRILLFIVGIVGVLLSVFHIFFYQIFSWKEELVQLSPINQGIMQVLNLAIIFFILYGAILTLILSHRKGFDRGERTVLYLFGGFYLWRAFLEFPFFGFDIQGLILVILCLFLGCVYFWNGFEKQLVQVAA